MSEEELDQLQALIELTSPGPWFTHHKTGLICWGDPKDDWNNYSLDNPEDDEFIIAARSAVPIMIAEIKRLRLIVTSLCERVAAQSELLSKRAEK